MSRPHTQKTTGAISAPGEVVSRHALKLRCHSLTEQLVSMDTSERGAGIEACADWLRGTLAEAGFSISLTVGAGCPPLVVAHRQARGKASGRVLIYNHYDVDEPGEGWSSPPFELTDRDGRWVGLGVGDNKGALAARLAALALLDDHSPELLWVIQGQEESGSALARSWFEEDIPVMPDLWIEENGWFDADGTQRVLAATLHPTHGLEGPSPGLSMRILSSLGAQGARLGLILCGGPT